MASQEGAVMIYHIPRFITLSSTSFLEKLTESNNMDVIGLIIAIIVLLVAWVIVSIPLWLAARVMTEGKATMGAAMLGMLLGGIVFVIVYAITYLATDIFTDSNIAVIVAVIISFLAFLGLYKMLFNAGWLRTLAIAILAIVFTVIILFIIGVILVAVGITVLGL